MWTEGDEEWVNFYMKNDRSDYTRMYVRVSKTLPSCLLRSMYNFVYTNVCICAMQWSIYNWPLTLASRIFGTIRELWPIEVRHTHAHNKVITLLTECMYICMQTGKYMLVCLYVCVTMQVYLHTYIHTLEVLYYIYFKWVPVQCSLEKFMSHVKFLEAKRRKID